MTRFDLQAYEKLRDRQVLRVGDPDAARTRRRTSKTSDVLSRTCPTKVDNCSSESVSKLCWRLLVHERDDRRLEAPEVHRDGGERRERHRLEAVVGVVTFERRVDVRRSTISVSRPSSTMHVPRDTGRSPTSARSSSKPTRQLWDWRRVARRAEERPRDRRGHRVGDAERFGQVQIILSGEHRVYGAAQATLDREADLVFLRPARGDVLFDLLSGFGIDDDDDVFKPEAHASEPGVDDALTVLANRC